MKLYEYSGKKVKITSFDGKEFSGIACDFIPAQDNTPEIASISIDEIEFYENEIKSITVID
ncbi:MAG: hypothetical protein IJD78_04275 [Clostridia bacterium]|nr:hypothetical protein [Clostridia bacterium]